MAFFSFETDEACARTAFFASFDAEMVVEAHLEEDLQTR